MYLYPSSIKPPLISCHLSSSESISSKVIEIIILTTRQDISKGDNITEVANYEDNDNSQGQTVEAAFSPSKKIRCKDGVDHGQAGLCNWEIEPELAIVFMVLS